MTYSTVVCGALLAATALVPAAPATAADPAPRGALSGSWFQLTVTRDSGVPASFDPLRVPAAPGGDTRGGLLLCDPPQGHPRAAGACAELETAGGDIGRIPAKQDAVCTMIYAPVTARASGLWHGRPVAYEEKFANVCAMEARTGAVFALDD